MLDQVTDTLSPTMMDVVPSEMVAVAAAPELPLLAAPLLEVPVPDEPLEDLLLEEEVLAEEPLEETLAVLNELPLEELPLDALAAPDDTPLEDDELLLLEDSDELLPVVLVLPPVLLPGEVLPADVLVVLLLRPVLPMELPDTEVPKEDASPELLPIVPVAPPEPALIDVVPVLDLVVAEEVEVPLTEEPLLKPPLEVAADALDVWMLDPRPELAALAVVTEPVADAAVGPVVDLAADPWGDPLQAVRTTPTTTARRNLGPMGTSSIPSRDVILRSFGQLREHKANRTP